MKGISTFVALLAFAVALIGVNGCTSKTTDESAKGVPQAAPNIDYQKWLNHEADQAAQIVLGDILLAFHEDKSDLNDVLWVNPGGIARDPMFSTATVPGSIVPRGLKPFPVFDLNADQAKAELEKRYKEKNMEVTFQVKNLRKCILVAGDFIKPGLYELSEEKPLGKVIEEAGGFSDKADQTLLSVFRKEAGAVSIKRFNYKKNTDETKAYLILPGDRITVLRKIIYSTN